MRDFFETMVSQDKLEIYEVDPEMATPDAIMNTVGSITPAKEDTVVFYYTGHAANTAEGKGAGSIQGQYFQLKDGNGKNAVLARNDVRKKLLATGAHFVVFFTDCSNSFNPVFAYEEVSVYKEEPEIDRNIEIDSGYSVKDLERVSDYFELVIQELFLDPDGILDMTASEYTQASFTNSMGSIGTLAWIEILKSVNTPKNTITWRDTVSKMNVRLNELFTERFANNHIAIEQGSQDYFVYEWPGGPRFGARIQIMGAGHVIVTEIVPGSIAEKGGLKVNDIIRKINGEEIENEKDFVTAIDKASGKTNIEIKRMNSDGKMSIIYRVFDFGGINSVQFTETLKMGFKCVEADGGLKITELLPKGTAEIYGFEVGDIILVIEGTTIDTKVAFQPALKDACQKENFVIIYRRDGENHANVIRSKDVLEHIPYRFVTLPGSKPVPAEKLDNPWFGVQFDEVDDGLEITKIIPGETAEKYGFEIGDVILNLDGMRVSTRNGFGYVLKEACEKSMFSVLFRRDGENKAAVIETKDVQNHPETIKLEAEEPAAEELEVVEEPEPVKLKPEKTYVFGAKVKRNVIQEVFPGSPADEAGLQEGDKIVKINNKKMRNSIDFAKAIDDSPCDAEFVIVKEGEEEETSVSVILNKDNEIERAAR